MDMNIGGVEARIADINAWYDIGGQRIGKLRGLDFSYEWIFMWIHSLCVL
jgi:hypothetical protein